MSRHWFIALVVLGPAKPLVAQALESQTGSPPQRIDILAPRAEPEPSRDRDRDRDCARKQEAAIISGEIIVCADREGDEAVQYDREEARDRYAAKTQGRSTPDVFGIPNHGMVVIRGCFIPPCPKPPALIIDVAALPEAPPGSDADRIARGLAPLGRNDADDAPPPTPAGQRVQLGLPNPDSVRPGAGSVDSTATPTAQPSPPEPPR